MGAVTRLSTNEIGVIAGTRQKVWEASADGTFDVTALSIAGTAVTSTAAELNILDGVTATAAELNILDGVTATAAEINQVADQSARFEIVTAANVITAAESGKDFVLSSTTGFQTTMPAISTAAGFRCRMWGGPLEVTGSNHTIITNAADTNKFFGAVSAGGIVVLIDTHDTLTLVADKWLAGDYLEFFCDGVQWHVTGIMGVTVGITSA